MATRTLVSQDLTAAKRPRLHISQVDSRVLHTALLLRPVTSLSTLSIHSTAHLLMPRLRTSNTVHSHTRRQRVSMVHRTAAQLRPNSIRDTVTIALHPRVSIIPSSRPTDRRRLLNTRPINQHTVANTNLTSSRNLATASLNTDRCQRLLRVDLRHMVASIHMATRADRLYQLAATLTTASRVATREATTTANGNKWPA